MKLKQLAISMLPGRILMHSVASSSSQILRGEFPESAKLARPGLDHRFRLKGSDSLLLISSDQF
jgi:hypothetical protein